MKTYGRETVVATPLAPRSAASGVALAGAWNRTWFAPSLGLWRLLALTSSRINGHEIKPL